MYYLKYDKTGLTAFCFTGPDLLMVKKCIQELHSICNDNSPTLNHHTHLVPMDAHEQKFPTTRYFELVLHSAVNSGTTLG
jgi:hypothetical protein